MPFRAVSILTAIAMLLLATSTAQAQQDPAQANDPSAPWFSSIAQLQQRMRNGQSSAVHLTQAFIQRITRLDQNGPNVNSVIELNPDALEIARKRDHARAAGTAQGRLFAIPVMVKDNIDSGDRMQTTAGSLAMVGAPASHDATVVAKLRRAGAILLGKTNLSEWANFRSSHATSGWSGRGGLTRNPYVLNRNACGSSAGSAAAVAAGFVTVALGTETDGSVICPSSVNGIVGIKPTLGLVSRAGIIPISHSQDTAGAMARTVTDAARLLTVIAGSDPRDPATGDADMHATDYTRFLKPGALKGKRIGVVRALAGDDPQVAHILDRRVAMLRAAGATVIDPVKLPHQGDYGKAEMTVLLYEFKHDLNAYLATRKGLKVKTLKDLIAFDRHNADREMPWFGQDLFLKAEAEGPLTDKTYTDALAKSKRLSGPAGIDAALQAHHLDALMTIATGPAWTTDLVNGDHASAAGYGPAAVAGYPSITVPAGSVHGLPVGVLFFAGKWSEPTLISIAYGFEQHAHARRRPHFRATVMAKKTDRVPDQDAAPAPAASVSQ